MPSTIVKQEGLAVASIARDVGSSSTNRSSDIMHFLPRLLKKTLQHDYINKTVTCFRSRLSVSKISDIATITNFSILPLPPEIPASSHPTIRVRRCQQVAKTSIYPSMQRYPGPIAPCDHNAQTSQTVYITSRANKTNFQRNFMPHVRAHMRLVPRE